MQRPVRLVLAALAFLAGAGFSTDSAGKACVRAQGERGVAYNTDRTKVSEAYSPNGRRLVDDGHQVYRIEVPALTRRDKPIQCVMRLDHGLWKAPSVRPDADPAHRDMFAPFGGSRS